MVNRWTLCATIIFGVTIPLCAVCKPGNVRRKLDQATAQKNMWVVTDVKTTCGK